MSDKWDELRGPSDYAMVKIGIVHEILLAHDALAARNAKLREALRLYCMRGPDYAGYERFCCECSTGWGDGEPEHHAESCLAAPDAEQGQT